MKGLWLRFGSGEGATFNRLCSCGAVAKGKATRTHTRPTYD